MYSPGAFSQIKKALNAVSKAYHGAHQTIPFLVSEHPVGVFYLSKSQIMLFNSVLRDFIYFIIFTHANNYHKHF